MMVWMFGCLEVWAEAYRCCTSVSPGVSSHIQPPRDMGAPPVLKLGEIAPMPSKVWNARVMGSADGSHGVDFWAPGQFHTASQNKVQSKSIMLL